MYNKKSLSLKQKITKVIIFCSTLVSWNLVKTWVESIGWGYCNQTNGKTVLKSTADS